MSSIAIDCRLIRHSGIGTYLRNLLRTSAFKGLGGELLLLGDPALLEGFPGKRRPFRPPLYSVGEQWRILPAWRRERFRLLHWPHYNLPLLSPAPVVATVHDMIHWIFPEALPSRAARLYARFFFSVGLRRARRIAAVSDCTRRDLVEIARFPPERVEVIPLAPGPEFRPPGPEELERWRELRGWPARYLLYLGNIRPLKNLPFLVEAFRAALPRLPPELHLLIAGRDFMPDWTASVRCERVRFLGEVPDRDLPFLYGGALALVFPSLYEGFGLPPLEAMACGCPVVASRAGALPETLGEAALLVDPQSSGELTAALERVAADEDLRRTLRQEGLARAASYSWESTGERTAALYRSVL